MSKIGIKIDKTHRGNGTLLEINEGDWSRKTFDCRNNLLPKLTGDKKNNVALVLSLIETGYLFILIKEIDGRDGDNLTAFIHVPYNTNISGRDLCVIIEGVKNKIKEEDLEDKGYFEKLVEKEYPAENTDIKLKYKSSDENAYIICDSADYNLSDLIGTKNLHQENYGKYKYVFFFLLEKGGLSCTDDVKELKPGELKNIVKVEALNNEEHGFEAYYKDNLFKEGYFIEGDDISITWKRCGGYEDIERTYKIDNSEFIKLEPKEEEIKKNIRLLIKDKKGKEIDDSSLMIKIEDEKIENPQKIPLQENKLKEKLKVEIKDNSGFYEEYKEDVLCKDDRIVITLKDKLIKVSEEIEGFGAIGDKTMTVEEFKKKEVKKMQHYDVDKNGYKIKYTPKKYSLFDKKKKIVCAVLSLCLFVAGIIGGWYLNAEIQSNKIEAEAEAKAKKTEDLKNLLAKEVWRESEMERHPELKGLWDAMNHYKFDKIKEYIKLYSLDEKNLRNVIEASFKGEKREGVFNDNDKDENITINKWLEAVKRKREEKTQPVSPGHGTKKERDENKKQSSQKNKAVSTKTDDKGSQIDPFNDNKEDYNGK